MDISAYIASGILEAYLLDELTPAERAEVEFYTEQYPEIRAELDRIERDMEALARLSAVRPPAGVLEKILNTMRMGGTVSPASDRSAPPAPVRRFSGWTLAAAIVSAVAIGMLWYQSSENTRRQEEANQALADLQTRCDSAALAGQTRQELLDFMLHPGTQPVILAGTLLAPDARMTVYRNTALRKDLVLASGMPPAPAGHDYQLWAIVDGQPVDMGVIRIVPGETLPVSIPFITHPQAFAVTIEKEGGSPTPTLDKMIVIGNAG